jgi:hypothetical protein
MLGISIHDPDVAFTDLGLALLASYFGWRLWKERGKAEVLRTAAVLMVGLAGAAFWGGLFHGLFPSGTATRSGFLIWIPVVLSIVVASSAMLHLALHILVPGLASSVQGWLITIYAASFAGVVLRTHESFASIVYFYVPALLLLLVAAARQAVQSQNTGWITVASGLVLSAVAALLQQARVAIHPVHFDHNAVYHVVQGIALVLMYRGFRPVPDRFLESIPLASGAGSGRAVSDSIQPG